MTSIQFGGIYRLDFKDVSAEPAKGDSARMDRNAMTNKMRFTAQRETGWKATTHYTDPETRYLITDDENGDHFSRFSPLESAAMPPRGGCIPDADGNYGVKETPDEIATREAAALKVESFIEDNAADVKTLVVEYEKDLSRFQDAFERGEMLGEYVIQKREVQ